MIRLAKILTLLMFAATFTGCVIKPSLEKEVISIPEDGKTYAFTYKSGMQAKGGGITTISGIAGGKCIVRNANGDPVISPRTNDVIFKPCEPKVVVHGINPDRVDTLGGAVLGAGAQVGSAYIKADAIKDAAKTNAEASGNSGSNVFVSTQTQTNVESDFEVSNCPPGGDCYSPLE